MMMKILSLMLLELGLLIALKLRTTALNWHWKLARSHWRGLRLGFDVLTVA